MLNRIVIVILFSGSILMSQSDLSFNTQTANAFLNSLNTVQKEKVLQKFDDNRTRWHYLPSYMFKRKGIYLKDLNDEQRTLLNKLLQSYLSQKGYNQTKNIMGLENVLRELEGSNRRDPDLYVVAFYGLPAGDKVWGWKFEGHHISLNFTVVDDKISYAPRFLGANPAEVPSGPRKGFRALKNEEDIALQLINSMDERQLNKAVFSAYASGDIITSNDDRVKRLEKNGILAKDLNKNQQQLLHKLIMEYISVMPDAQAEKRMKQVENSHFELIRFGWAGETKLHEPHYYYVQGDEFLIELDNTQNHANHIHSIWRDFDGDFGRDLIREHYQNSNDHDH